MNPLNSVKFRLFPCCVPFSLVHIFNLPTIMKLSYINHVPIAPGELSVILAESAEDIMRHSCALALKAQSIGMGTLIINCGMSDRRFKEKSDVLLPIVAQASRLHLAGETPALR